MENVVQIADRLQFQTSRGTRQSQENCSRCHDAGWVPIGDRVKRCDCWLQKTIRATIPDRFANCTFANYNPVDKAQERGKFNITKDIRGSYYIVGPYGRGKTHLLFSQYRELLQYRRCLVRTTKQMIDELTAHDLGKAISPLRDALESSGKIHLFWDDADKLKVTDYKLEVLYDLVDRVYRNNHSMTITSNIDIEGIQDIVGPAAMRRICDICAVVRL